LAYLSDKAINISAKLETWHSQHKIYIFSPIESKLNASPDRQLKMTAGQSQIICKRRQIHYKSNQLRLEARTSQTGSSMTPNLNMQTPPAHNANFRLQCERTSNPANKK